MKNIFIIYLIVINIITFIVFGIDKKRAKQKRWRIPELTLFLLSILGGSFGGITGMCVFHHKTRKLHFMLGIPLIFITELVLIYFYFLK